MHNIKQTSYGKPERHYYEGHALPSGNNRARHQAGQTGNYRKTGGVASITCEKPPGTAMNAGRNLV